MNGMKANLPKKNRARNDNGKGTKTALSLLKYVGKGMS